MGKKEYSEETLKYLESRKPLQIGDWTASCTGKTFKMGIIDMTAQNYEKSAVIG